MRLLVALTAVFATEWGIAMFNRAFVHALSRDCEENDAQATVLVLNDDGSRQEAAYLSPGRVRLRGYARNKPAFALAFWREAWKRPDLTLLGHVNLLPLAAPLAVSRLPYWLIAHGDEAWRRLPVLSRRMLARAQTVLAVSDFTRRKLATMNDVPGEHWQILPNTLDPFWALPLESPAARGRNLTLLSVTRLDRGERSAKGVLHVLEVLPELRSRFPGLRYVVVGDGNDRAWLEAHSRALGLGDAVTFTGHISREALAGFYAACDIFALPSDKEGFGIVYLEAMAAGKPVVAARAGGVPEVVVDGETGLLVEHGNKQALIDAVGGLLADADRRRCLGAAGLRRLQDRFTYDVFCQRLCDLLRSAGGATA
jgi:glycosyltransferase involved in cell wall biosynthesis